MEGNPKFDGIKYKLQQMVKSDSRESRKIWKDIF